MSNARQAVQQILESQKSYTLPELAKVEGIKIDGFVEWVGKVLQRVEDGEFELCKAVIGGIQVPVVRRLRGPS